MKKLILCSLMVGLLASAAPGWSMEEEEEIGGISPQKKVPSLLHLAFRVVCEYANDDKFLEEEIEFLRTNIDDSKSREFIIKEIIGFYSKNPNFKGLVSDNNTTNELPNRGKFLEWAEKANRKFMKRLKSAFKDSADLIKRVREGKTACAKWTQSKSRSDLNLSRMRLIELPDEILVYSTFKQADLSRNMFCHVPEAIFTLTNLRELDLTKNCLKVLPESISKLTSLRVLDLSNNCLKTLPKGIGKLAYLRTLDLRNNYVESLPEEMSGLICLESLNLDINSLSEIPSFIFRLLNLKEFVLGTNPIKTVPSEIGNLRYLNKLLLYYNGLTSLPVELKELEDLRIFHVEGNPELQKMPFSRSDFPQLTDLTLDSRAQFSDSLILEEQKNRINEKRKLNPGKVVGHHKKQKVRTTAEEDVIADDPKNNVDGEPKEKL